MILFVVCLHNQRKVKITLILIMFSNIERIVDKDLVVQEVHMESSMVTTSIWRKIVK